MDDETAIACLKQGDMGGLQALVRRYQGQALRTAYLVCLQQDLAQDVVQDAFILAWERIAQFDSRRAFAPWFMRIVTNQALMAVRRQQPAGLDSVEDALPDESPSPEQLLEAAETREQVRSALASMTALQRSAIVLRYYVGMDQTEMGSVLGIPVGTVKRRLHDARQRLRRLLTTSAHSSVGQDTTRVQHKKEPK